MKCEKVDNVQLIIYTDVHVNIFKIINYIFIDIMKERNFS